MVAVSSKFTMIGALQLDLSGCSGGRIDRRAGCLCLRLAPGANILWLFPLMSRRGLLLHILFGRWQVAGEVMNHHRYIIGRGLYFLRKEGVDLGSHEQNHSEVVEEKQQHDRETNSAGIAA